MTGAEGWEEGRTKVAVLPCLEVFSVEMGRCLGCVVGEEAHVAPESDRILW